MKNELGAATLAARQKEFIQKNSGIVFGEFFHFLDSMIVQDMLAKDLYGFNTFGTKSSGNTAENKVGRLEPHSK